MKHLSILSLIVFFGISLNAQEITNNIRGRVIDKASRQSLPGASIVVIGSDPVIGTTTDENGYFKLSNVEVGRVGVMISFIGYETQRLENLQLSGSKELVLNIELQESYTQMKEVVVTAESRKDETVNKMATVSARTFSVQEAERYAGSRNDVARMATNFAGVRGANDASNDIVIRGNSSNGLLWRLDGIDIPNPNHFGDLGATGGPVSMLNSNILAKSDFFTAAFPAEYGNATSGVFDLHTRNGNDQEHEFLGQVGFNGFELGAEGPISREKRSSYLANVRYSTLEVMQEIGLDFGTGTAIPKYKDATIKLNFPSVKYGTISVFAMGGNSSIDLLGSTIDTNEVDVLYGSDNLDIYDRNQMGVAGITHKKILGESAYSSLTIAVTHFKATEQIDTVSHNTREACDCDFYLEEERNNKYFVHWFVGKKFNSRNNIKSGVIFSHLDFKLFSEYLDDDQTYENLSDENGQTQLIQPYVQWQWRPTARITVNSGVHAQYLRLNDSYSIEPRAGMKYQINEKNQLSAGYGLHSKMPDMQILFVKRQDDDGAMKELNRDLGFTKSHHFVVGYDRSLGNNARLKTEVYYQRLFDVPVSDIPSPVSLINRGAQPGGFRDSLENFVNEGLGENYGLELTLERFMKNGSYFLVTASVYESLFRASDGIWRSTAWNSNFVFNALGGKEFELNKNKVGRKSKTFLFMDGKVTYAGGQRFVPLDLEASRIAEDERYELQRGYSGQFADYFRLDLNIGIKVMGKKATQEWSIMTQNVTNHSNAFAQQYDSQTGSTRMINQLGFFFVPQYRITF